MPSRRPLRWLRWTVAGVAAVAVLAVGGTYVYIHFIEGPAPAPLGLKATKGDVATPPGQPGQSASAGALAGTWRVTSGSLAGYRVKEVLLGQNNIAMGRTSHVKGDLTIKGNTVTAAAFTVAMATIHSDQSQRDAQFDGRIMDTASYPTGTLTLASPINLGTLPAAGTIGTYQATANLTLHGHTRSVTFALQAERTSTGIEVSGSIPIVFADYGIANPSFSGFVTTQDHGLLEFLVKFSRT